MTNPHLASATKEQLSKAYIESVGYEPFASGWSVEEVREILSEPELSDAYKKLGAL